MHVLCASVPQRCQENQSWSRQLAADWIKTKPDEGLFMYFRFCGPLEPFYDKSWKLNDVVLIE